jgi:hypothetical protein
MFFLELFWRKIFEVNDLPPCVLADGWSRFTSEFQASGVSNVVLRILLEENHRSDMVV